MKIRVEFTVNIPATWVPSLRELAAADDDQEIREFVRTDVAQYLVDYLTANGVNDITIEREKI